MEENADGIEKKWVYSIKDIVCLRIERVNLRIGHFGETIIFYEKYELAFLLIFYFLIPRIGKKRPQLPPNMKKKIVQNMRQKKCCVTRQRRFCGNWRLFAIRSILAIIYLSISFTQSLCMVILLLHYGRTPITNHNIDFDLFSGM